MDYSKKLIKYLLEQESDTEKSKETTDNSETEPDGYGIVVKWEDLTEKQPTRGVANPKISDVVQDLVTRGLSNPIY